MSEFVPDYQDENAPSYEEQEQVFNTDAPNPVLSGQDVYNTQVEEHSEEQPSEQPPITADAIANMSEEELENLTTEDMLQQVQQQYQGEDGLDSSTDREFREEFEGTLSTEEQQQTQGMSDAEFRQFLTSSFRANNTDVQVESAEDIRKLMQMGMNYQKKLGKIRPHLRAVKSLEQAGLLDEEKLNRLIDAANHKPEAIASLLKEAEIDTYDLPDLDEVEYTPNNHIMSDEQYSLNEVVEDLRESETGQQVMKNVLEWDDSSKAEIFSNPEILKTIHEQVETGLYQEAMSIIERDRSLGKIPDNVTNIDAYDYVATHLMHTDPRFNSQGHVPKQQRVVGNNLKSHQPTYRRSNSTKQSASIPNNASRKQVRASLVDPIDIANMSEEELAKFGSFEDYVRSVQFRK